MSVEKIHKLVVKAEDVKGNDIKSPVPHAWAAFLNGYWTKTIPQKPGKYMLAHKSGRVLGAAFVYFEGGELQISIRDGALSPLKTLTGQFWWWSTRMPPVMPRRVPAWGDGVDGAVPPARPKLTLVTD